MDTEDLLAQTLENLKIDNAEIICSRRDELTRALNEEFRDSKSKTKHRLMVGSWGRHTAINGVSDLDMLYILPTNMREKFTSEGGSSKTLAKARQAFKNRYPSTNIKVDRLVIVVEFRDFKFEIQPVFENDDSSFQYPDTYSDSWKTTKPREEIRAMQELNSETNGAARNICRLVRAWKCKHNVPMNGLLIDTLVWRFCENKSPEVIRNRSISENMLEFFLFLSTLPKQESWNALGSNQKVRVKKNFQRKAKKAHDLCATAIDSEGNKNMCAKWRSLFGRFVPVDDSDRGAYPNEDYLDTEEFIEDLFAINDEYSLTVKCKVTQDGYRPRDIVDIIKGKGLLKPRLRLEFRIVDSTVPEPYKVYWKVLNRGPVAIRKNQIRGQIISGNRNNGHVEHTKFRGDHYVECYAVKDGVVVATAHQDVPIE